MAFLRYFWDAAVDLDPTGRQFDEGFRFPICRPDRLRELFSRAGFSAVGAGSIEITTHFNDFDDYWTPFSLGQGPAPGYLAGLSDVQQRRLKERVRVALPQGVDGTIDLTAIAWIITGTV